ncbi:MAG TPA: BTAD domain-containing putative transcriptional regulator [Mycobacteriales bacterium]|nr:BTAD domain-containing putative transcriptional regulator [Mycobacteriales bacterium]
MRQGELDLDRVNELDVAAACIIVAGTRAALEQSAALLSEALTLWRGPVLAGIVGAASAAEATRLEERALTLLERRVDVDLRLGRSADLAGELQARVRAHPLREPLWARLILALYSTGRQADAFAAYQEVRRILIDQLGIEPGVGLQRLERAILARADPTDLLRREAGEPAIDGDTPVRQPAAPRPRCRPSSRRRCGPSSAGPDRSPSWTPCPAARPGPLSPPSTSRSADPTGPGRRPGGRLTCIGRPAIGPASDARGACSPACRTTAERRSARRRTSRPGGSDRRQPGDLTSAEELPGRRAPPTAPRL